MNKYVQRFALFLIDRRMKKAADKDGIEYANLRHLRFNIKTINNFWQGTFAPFGWQVWPKNKKHIEELPKVEKRRVQEYPMSQEDKHWADLILEDYLEELQSQDHLWPEYKIVPPDDRDYSKSRGRHE